MSSTTVEYAITFFIGILLVTAIVTPLTDIVDSREETVTEEHLEQIGIEIVTLMIHHDDSANIHDSHVDDIDSLSNTPDTEEYESSVVIGEPPEVNGNSYSVQVSANGDELILSSSEGGVEARTPIPDDIDVVELSGGSGGRLLITHNGDEIRLESGTIQVDTPNEQ